jgi:lactoylglutathione lyase
MKLSLVTMHTSKMEESLQFYQQILSMKIVNEIKPSENMRIVFLKGIADTMIELIEDEKLTVFDKVSAGLAIGFEVENLDEILEIINQHGIKIGRGPVKVSNEHRLLFIEDPNGVVIEFIEGHI